MPLYVSGSDFWIGLSVKNMDKKRSSAFSMVTITVAYSGTRLTEKFDAMLPSFEAEAIHEIRIDNHLWGVLASGHALVYAQTHPPSNLCDAHGRRIENYDPDLGSHVHSFYSQSRGELYTLVALGVTVFFQMVPLIVSFIVNWERLCDWLNQLVRHLADC